MMRRLNKGGLTTEDISYINREEEMWAEVERWEMGYYQEGVKDGRKEGKREGLKEGVEKGRAQTMLETVIRMLNKGKTVAEIAELLK